MNGTGRRALLLAIVCFVLGVGLVAQLRGRRGQNAPGGAVSVDQSAIMGSLVVVNAELRSEVQKLQGQLQAYERAPERGGLPEMNEELRRMRIVNGTVAVTGPGVEVRIGAGVNAVDLQDMLNEIRNVGAEAIGLNDVRLTIASALSSDNGGMLLDGRRIEPPFVFKAIGDPPTMATALSRRGGVLELLRVAYPGLQAEVKTVQRISLPAVREQRQFVLGRPVS